MSEEKVEQVFQVLQPARLVVKNIRGSVDIHPGEDGAIHVTAVKHTGSGDAKATEIEIFQEASGEVKVVTHFPDGGWRWLFGSMPCRVDYIVTAPRQSSLKVSGVSNSLAAGGFEGEFSFKSVSGEMELNGLKGPTNINTVSGKVELKELTGDVHLNTVSGGVDGKRLAGRMHMDTVSGDIALEGSNLASMETTTVSGKVNVETPLGEGPYRFNSVSGRVGLKVPAEAHCSAELHSVSGSLRVDLPTTSQGRSNGTQLAEVQGGGVKVYLNSVSGDLSLEK